MQKHVLGALALLFVALTLPGEANALVQRTFVSGLGSDANPCTRTEPCRTFGAAIAQTQAGGEVLALDTAGYGPVTITQAISLISPPGVYAGITTTTPGTNAIAVNAGANDVVVLKGLSLSGLNLGNAGVVFLSGNKLRVENLTVSGFTGNGIVFSPAATGRMSIVDSLIRDNGATGVVAGSSQEGVLAHVTVDHSRLVGNSNGLLAFGNSRVTVRDGVAAGNSSVGYYAATTSDGLNVENCLAMDNGFGIWSGGLVRVAGTTVTDNTTGVFADAGGGGSLLSRGNNTVEGNGTDGTFTGLFLAK